MVFQKKAVLLLLVFGLVLVVDSQKSALAQDWQNGQTQQPRTLKKVRVVRRVGNVATSQKTSESEIEKSSGIGLDFHLGAVMASGSTSNKDANNVMKNTFGLGLGVGYDLTVIQGTFFLHPELNYVQRGYAVSLSDILGPGLNEKGTFRLNYLELPVLLKAEVPTSGVRPNVVAGPSVAVLTSKSAVFHATIDGEDFESSYSSIDSILIKTLDYGLQFGAGLNIPVSDANSIVVDFRYYLGLSNITNSPAAAGNSVKNRSMGLTIGFKL